MKHVLITGGSRGIGAAMVKKFFEEGYRVSFTYCKSTERAQVLADTCHAIAVYADNEDAASIQAAYEKIRSVNGEADILINNAAISEFCLFGDITYAAWSRMMRVNLDGAFLWTQAVLPNMIHEKKGSILNISSIWGLTGASCEVHYSTSKAALIGMTRALAKEVAPSGITVNCIAPGVIDTDMNAMLSKEAMEELKNEIPVGRLGSPEEVAELAWFLSSEKASYLTGQVISPNGGFVI